MGRKLVAGNWKMNGLTADGVALAQAVARGWRGGGAPGPDDVDVLVCPPATLLVPVVAALAGGPVAVGGQDCHAEGAGAHTGDIAAPMLRDCGATWVILGHSERRRQHGETDALVRAKAGAAHRAGLAAIVCIGETEAERDAGRTLEVLGTRLEGAVPPGADGSNTVIAYEPVWAIGTGRTPSAAQIAEAHRHIRRCLGAMLADPDGVRLLYGGSVKPDNAAGLLSIDHVDGALVGGASLQAADFLAIAAAAAAARHAGV